MGPILAPATVRGKDNDIKGADLEARCVSSKSPSKGLRLMRMGVAGRNDILPDVEHGFALGQKVKFEI